MKKSWRDEDVAEHEQGTGQPFSDDWSEFIGCTANIL